MSTPASTQKKQKAIHRFKDAVDVMTTGSEEDISEYIAQQCERQRRWRHSLLAVFCGAIIGTGFFLVFKGIYLLWRLL